jgi:mediator of replication checkpoint protein 1
VKALTLAGAHTCDNPNPDRQAHVTLAEHEYSDLSPSGNASTSTRCGSRQQKTSPTRNSTAHLHPQSRDTPFTMSTPASSAPGTPVRSRVASPIILTPRSKIAALMADSFSDSDDSDEAPKPAVRRKSSKPESRQSPPQESQHSPPQNSAETPLFAPQDDDFQSEAEDEDDDDIPATSRPRGKIAAALYDEATKQQKKAAASEDEDETPRKSSPIAASPEPADSDDEELPENPLKNARFLELVAKKRAEREAREAAEKQKEAERRARIRALEKEQGIRFPGQDEESDSDEGSGRAKERRAPRRKAGKKALEEMHRETQRLARSMQLTHEARTRKKVTKQSLFEKFGFKTEDPAATPTEPSQSKSAITQSASPQEKQAESDELPDAFAFLTEDVSKSSEEETLRPKLDKGKGKEVIAQSPKGKGKEVIAQSPKGKGKAIDKNPTMPRVRVNLPIRTLPDNGSDDELEIVKPEDEAKQLLSEKQALIASLRKPRPIPKKAVSPNGKAKVSAKTLHQQLLQKSRLQAIKEREERIEELKAKGIIVQTAEEREKEMLEVESLLEKARKEALEIRKREQRAAKMEKGESVDDDPEESDFEWMESGEEEQYSGEDEDEEGEEEQLSGDHETGEESETAGIMIDGEAEDSESDKDMEDAPHKSPTPSLSPLRDSASPTPRLSEMPAVEVEDSDNDDGGFAPFKRKVQRKKQRVIDDDEESDEDVVVPATQTPAKKQTPMVPDIFQNMGQAPAMGMTQLFAGSIGGSAPFGTIGGGGDIGAKVDQMRQLPDEILPNSQAPDSIPETQLTGKLTLDYSQSQTDMPVLTLDYSQSQIENLDSLPTQQMPFSLSTQQMVPDPTQDTGFEKKGSSPMGPRRFESSPAPTIPTQPLSPPKKRGGRRLRRAADFSDEEHDSSANDEDHDSSADEAPRNAFTLMKKSAKKPPKPAFDKTKSEAKDMFHEQASESEDEYAGLLGGGDDEEEVGLDSDADEEMADLVDDSHADVDTAALAAFYAQREKASDEKAVNKLFRDITNGMLRKKRGAGFDLDDDSDDEYAAQERRRRQKRRQMQQIRQALLKDEKLGVIAKDPKKAAFFKVLEDNESDEESDFLSGATQENLLPNLEESQSQSQSQDVAMGDGEDEPSQSQSAAPQQRPRRPVRTKKPALAEIREVSPHTSFSVFPPLPFFCLSSKLINQTLSFLGVEEPTTNLSASSDSEAEEDSQQRRASSSTVIDRTLATTTSSKPAFATGFKVPTLLRRATTGQAAAAAAAMATTERSLAEGAATAVKKGGKKSINFQHAKKTAVLEKGEERKKREREREAKERVGRGLKGLGVGRFE